MAFIEKLIHRLNEARGDTRAQAAVAAEFVLMVQPEPERELLRSALDAASVLRWFDVILMAKVLGIPDGEAQKRFEELKALPFVERYRRMGEHDPCNVHESTRLGWRQQLARNQPQDFATLSAKVAEYFADDFTAAGRINWVYHLLCGDPKRGARELESLDRNWDSCARPNDRYGLASALRELDDTLMVQGVARVRVLLVTAWARVSRGEVGPLADDMGEILHLARAAGDPRAEADAQRLLGDAFQAQGKLETALEAFVENLAISRRLAEQDPSNLGWQRDLAVALSRVGDVLQAQGKLEATLEAYGEDLAIVRRLSEQDPSNSGWQRGFALAQSRIGGVLEAQGKLEAARTAFGQTIAINRRLTEQDPSNSDWQQDLAVAHRKFGDVLQAQGELEAAQAAFREGLAITRRLDLAITRSLVEQDSSNSDWQTIGRRLAEMALRSVSARPDQGFDFFLNHPQTDAEFVEAIGSKLTNEAGLRVWFDRWILISGQHWQQQMARGLEQSQACAIFIGGNTPSSWFREEIERALDWQTRDSGFRVIPVLLPNGDRRLIEDFLELRTWVEFEEGLVDANAFHLLVSAVRGIHPGRRSRVEPQQSDSLESVKTKLSSIRDLRFEKLINEEIALEYEFALLDEIPKDRKIEMERNPTFDVFLSYSQWEPLQPESPARGVLPGRVRVKPHQSDSLELVKAKLSSIRDLYFEKVIDAEIAFEYQRRLLDDYIKPEK
jgi:tetratricopeptide (TPR) repeat protein